MSGRFNDETLTPPVNLFLIRHHFRPIDVILLARSIKQADIIITVSPFPPPSSPFLFSRANDSTDGINYLLITFTFSGIVVVHYFPVSTRQFRIQKFFFSKREEFSNCIKGNFISDETYGLFRSYSLCVFDSIFQRVEKCMSIEIGGRN